MPAMKRKFDGPLDATALKKSRSEPGNAKNIDMDATQLLRKTQQKLDASAALKESSGNVDRGSNADWTPEKITEKAHKIREICHKEIKKQMKWQPSCKTGTTKWSYTGVVPNHDVFRSLIREEKNAKAWKLEKMPMSEFSRLFGYITVSCRYNYLSVTGESVTVRWNAEDLTFQLSGTYGI